VSRNGITSVPQEPRFRHHTACEVTNQSFARIPGRTSRIEKTGPSNPHDLFIFLPLQTGESTWASRSVGSLSAPKLFRDAAAGRRAIARGEGAVAVQSSRHFPNSVRLCSVIFCHGWQRFGRYFCSPAIATNPGIARSVVVARECVFEPTSVSTGKPTRINSAKFAGFPILKQKRSDKHRETDLQGPHRIATFRPLTSFATQPPAKCRISEKIPL